MAKQHWTCVRSVRGGAAPDCQKKLKAGPDDFKALRQAGWRQVTGPGARRLLFECAPCARSNWAKHAKKLPSYGPTTRAVIQGGQHKGRRGSVIGPSSRPNHMDVDIDGFGRLPIDKSLLRILSIVERIGELEHRLANGQAQGL